MDRPPTCRFYQAGVCLNDDLCPFSHPTYRCRTFSTNGWCPYGVACHFWHDPDRSLIGFESSPVQNQQVCRFFLNGQCKYGDKCSYSHQIDIVDDSHLTLNEYRRQRAIQGRPLRLAIHANSIDGNRARVVSVNASHKNEPSYSNREIMAAPSRPPTARPTARLEQAYLDSIQTSDLEQMKELDVDRLLKRYPSHQLKEVRDNESLKSFNLLFSSTDPDWSHEVKKIVVCIRLPAEYPLKPPILSIPKTSDLPNVVTKHVNEAINEWVSERIQSYRDANKVALYLRPFLFWLDKKLQTLFTEGYAKVRELTATTADCLSPAISEEALNIPDRFTDSSSSDSTSSYITDESQVDKYADSKQNSSVKAANVPKLESPITSLQSSTDVTLFENPCASTDTPVDSSYRQQRITFEDLEFRGQAGTCLFTKFTTSCFCSRCKYIFQWVFRLPSQSARTENLSHTSLQSLPPNTATCIRCRQSLGLLFDAVLAHSFSSTIGDFSVANCLISDVQIKTAEVTIQCTNCSSVFILTGLEPDRLTAKRCKNCHSPCGLIFSNVNISSINTGSAELTKRFAALSVKTSSEGSKTARRSKLSQLTGSQAHVVQKGTPLPNDGTCKHYAKSFRWFRFQCCNRVYPCDVCHNEEAANSHELLFANRIICGFCSKEQVYSSVQKCIACHKALTAVHTVHWEGGKGCRDKVKMSRKDSKKFANLSKKQSK